MQRPLAALGLLLLTTAATAAGAPRARPAAEEPDEVVRLEAWPELEGSCKKGVARELSRLRKARTEEMATSAAENLRACGAAAVPALLEALGKERDEDARERLLDVLLATTGAPHTRLLAREFDHESLHVRRFALQRVAALPDPGVRAAAEAAVAAVAARGDDADARERYLAALCATSAGSLEGFDACLAAAEDDWRRRGAELRVALRAARGPAASERGQDALREAGTPAARVAALNVLAACGVGDAALAVRPHLDSDDNTVRVAAVNALRGIVDDDPPLEDLPVFEAIERAKRWKTRELTR